MQHAEDRSLQVFAFGLTRPLIIGEKSRSTPPLCMPADNRDMYSGSGTDTR